MTEKIGFSESVWAHLRDHFPEGGCATDVAKAIGSDTTSVSQALVAMTNRGAVKRLPNTDEIGRMLFVAYADAKFRRPRADKGVPPPKGKRMPKKKAARTTAVATRATTGSTPVELEPGAHFAVDGTWHVLVRDGTSSVRISPAIALFMRDWLDQLSPALEAAQ